MLIGLIGLAFSAGILAFLNPCSFTLLPAYLSYFFGNKTEKSENTLINACNGFKYGSIASFGFLFVFGTLGVVVSIFGNQVKSFLPWIFLIIPSVIIVLGIFWILDKNPLYISQFSLDFGSQRSSFFLFGSAYALSSLACVFPVFLMVVSSAISTGGFVDGLLVFLFYSLGMSLMMIVVSVAVVLSKEVLIQKFSEIEKYIKKISGAILIIAGFYLIYYWHVTF